MFTDKKTTVIGIASLLIAVAQIALMTVGEADFEAVSTAIMAALVGFGLISAKDAKSPPEIPAVVVAPGVFAPHPSESAHVLEPNRPRTYPVDPGAGPNPNP